MAFTRDEIKQLDRLNKKKAVWEKHGVSNMAIRNVDNMLENFYMGLAEKGYTISNNMERFTMRSDLTPEQERQLLQIADYMESHKTTSMGYYNKKLTDSAQKAYDTAIDKGYVKPGDRQSYIDFIDFMNESQAVKESAEMLGSAVIARIYGYGKDKGLTSDEINDLIINNYSDFKNGDLLQNYIFDEIDTIYEKRQKS